MTCSVLLLLPQPAGGCACSSCFACCCCVLASDAVLDALLAWGKERERSHEATILRMNSRAHRLCVVTSDCTCGGGRMVGPAVELVLLLLVVDAKSLRTVPDFGLWGFGALELWGFEVGGWERELGEGVGRLGLGEGVGDWGLGYTLFRRQFSTRKW